MSRTRSIDLSARVLRAWVGLCLIVAIAAQGLVVTVGSMLGATHSHRDAAERPSFEEPMRGWHDFRRTNHLSDSAVHAHLHAHSVWERHHHDPSDSSVVRHDGGGETDAAAQYAGSPGGVLAPAPGCTVRAPVCGAGVSSIAWSIPPTRIWSSHSLDRLDRPPNA